MHTAWLIFIGAGLGGLLRFYFSHFIFLFLPKNFPYGTLFVNVSGCLVMGILFILIFDRFSEISQELRAFLLIGLLGGYTTFSTFSIETIQLLESGDIFKGFLNAFLSVFLCLVATWMGVLIGRQ